MNEVDPALNVINGYEFRERITFRDALRRNIPEKGIACGTRDAIQQAGGVIRRVVDANTQAVLNDGPTILLVTHKYAYDMLAAVAGLPEPRSQGVFRDVKLIAEAAPPGTWLENYVLPLYNVTAEERSLSQKLNGLRGKRQRLRLETGEATSRNFLTMTTAANHVVNDGIVVLCPEGIGKKDGPWQKGAGGLIKLTKDRLATSSKKGFVVMCDVQGINVIDFLSDKLSRKAPALHPFRNVNIRYSEPILLSDIPSEGWNIMGITRDIENRYREWLNN